MHSAALFCFSPSPMKNNLLLALAVLSSFFTPHRGRADAKPEVFASQRNARSVEISPDGNLLMVRNSDDDYQIWDVPTHRPLWKLEDNWTFFSPDSRFIVVVAPKTPTKARRRRQPPNALATIQVDLRDARTGRLGRSLRYKPLAIENYAQDSRNSIVDCSFSSDGREFRLATRYRLRRWSVASGRLLGVQRWNPTSTPVFSAEDGRFSPDGRVFLARQDVPLPDVFLDAGTARWVYSVKEPVGGSYGFSADGYSFWMQGMDGNDVGVFRVRDNKLLWRTSDFPVFSPDGKLAYISASHGLDVLDARTGLKVRHLTNLDVDKFTPSPDGKWLYEAHGGKIYRWRTL